MSKPLVRVAALVVAVCVCAGGHLAGQVAVSPPPHADSGQPGPFRCWWTAGTRAVEVGERFTIVVTCAILESGASHAAAGMDQFDPTALMLAPFEVVSGTRHQDLLAPPWRYFQYEYTVRLLSDRLFGQDVDLPSVALKYQIESRDEGIRGREDTYLLPALPMRIMSRVPANATDITDASRETFGDLERRRARITEELVAAGILFSFSLVFVALALTHLVTGRRGRVPASARPLPIGSVLSECLGAARLLKSDIARDGWTAERAGGALTVFRIAGAIALGRPISQTLGTAQDKPREGQLLVRKGTLRRRSALVSAATTLDTLVARRTGVRAAGLRMQATISEIEAAMRTLTVARYAPGGAMDSTALDAALDSGIAAVRRLRTLKLWPPYRASAVAKPMPTLGSQA